MSGAGVLDGLAQALVLFLCCSLVRMAPCFVILLWDVSRLSLYIPYIHRECIDYICGVHLLV